MVSDSQTIKMKISRENFSKLLMENNLQSRVSYPYNLPIRYGGRTHFQTSKPSKTTSYVLCLKNYWRIYTPHGEYEIQQQAFNTRGRRMTGRQLGPGAREATSSDWRTVTKIQIC